MISNRRGITHCAAMALIVILAAVATTPMLAAAPDAKPAPRLDRDMEVQVVDSVSKEPIPGAAVSISMSGVQTRKDQTEDKGRVWVLLPEKNPSYLSIGVKMDGYVTNRIEYREGYAIPETYTVELVRGISIGGTIHDEQGNPIADVEVTSMFPGGDAAMRKRVNYYETVTVRSDDQGRWRCNSIPSDLKDVSIKVIHPEFISDGAYGYTSKLPMEDLRAMKGTIVMKRGLRFAGVVLDAAGQPITNALVLQGTERYGGEFPETQTDREGRFVFKNSRPGPTVLTVTAKGHAPETKEIKVAKDMPAIEIRLPKGNTLRGKVIDVAGKPVGGAVVVVEHWRRWQTLQWKVNTKADGTFVWNDAPAEEMDFTVWKAGYMYVRNFRMTAAEKDYVITLPPRQKIHGTVVDAETGKAIENFLLVPGKQYENGQIYWERNNYGIKKWEDGRFELDFDEPALARLLSVVAPGYLPAISLPYKMDQGDVVFDAKLKKGSGLSGIVRLADNTPAAGVDVVLATTSGNVDIRDGRLVSHGANPLAVTTAADGEFEFPAQLDAFVLFALGDAGFVELTAEQLKASKDVKLQPWGKVVGVLKKGSKPWPDQTVFLSYDWGYHPEAPRYNMQYEAKTDQNGNFTFERVVPRETRVSRQLWLHTGRHSSYTYSHPEKITVKPGETVNVQVGGKGRPVIGKIIIPNDPVSQAWTMSGNLNTKLVQPKPPDGFDEWSDEKIKEWWAKQAQSKERKDYENNRRYYAFAVEDDGTFRVEDVAPGIYQLTVHATDGEEGMSEPVASGQVETTIGEIPGGQSDEPLDVGALELKPTQSLKNGAELPTTIIKTIDGPAVNIADYKGKFVLIHFWTTRNKQLPAELPVLKEIYDTYGKDGRLVMIGVDQNSIPATAKAFAEQNGMKWVQAYVGMNSTIYQDLGIRQHPPRLLIGPDGKLIDNVTKLENLKQAIAKAIGKAAPQRGVP